MSSNKVKTHGKVLKLLHLVTKAKTEEWPKENSWKEMQLLTKNLGR